MIKVWGPVFGDALQGLSRPDELVSTDNGQLTFKVADAQYDEVNTTTTSTSHKASELNASGNITLDAISDITIEGSDINAQGNANVIAQGDVTIKETVGTFNETTDETHGSAELSVVVQHQAVEVAKAAKAVDEAKDQLKQAEADYRRYQKDTAQLETQLAQLEADLAAGKPGVTQADINEVASLLDDVKGDEAWYQAGIATASANVASKVTLLTQQSAAAAQSTATYGFNAGVQLDIAASQTSSNTHVTESRGSNVNANNINILTGNDGQSGSTHIAGSALNAQNTLNVFTDELTLTASKNTQQSSSDSQSGNITIAQTLWGVAGGPTVNASLNSSEQQDRATTYTNSSLTANTLNVVTANDANITGANLHGEDSLTLNVGGDLTFTSVQNRYSGSSKGFGISAGAGFSPDTGDASSANGGLNASTGRYQTTETALTSITGGNVNVDVNGNTAITGALIAAIDENGEDNGQLDLTTGTLSYSDLTNRSYSSNQSASVNANVGLTANAKHNPSGTDTKLNSSSYTYQNESNQSLSKAMATVGEGNVTVGGEEAELAGLNRDTENTTNEIYDVDRQQGNIDLTVDHRLLSEEGRAQIAEDVEITADKVSDIASSIGEGVEEFTDTLGITNLSDDERLELAEQINEALPSDLEALQLASAEIEEQTKEQQLTTMASNIFGDEVDPDATVQVTSQTGEVISISYREVMIDFMDRGADALHSFVDTVNDDSIQNVENQDVLMAAKNAAENYLATYNENKPLYDALENFASAPLIAKMVTEGVTDVAQATGILEKTAQVAGDLQGAAIASLQKLKAGVNKLTGSGAAKTADDKVDDVASNADVIGKDVKTDTVRINTSNAQKGTPEYDMLNDLQPNTPYELDNGTTFRTNEAGYVENITFTPTLEKMPRDSRQTSVGREGLDTDVGGHIQACSLGGTCDRYNLFPQDQNFNNSAYKKFEAEIRKSLKNNESVSAINVTFKRNDPNSARPDSLIIKYKINGVPKTRRFENKKGG